MAPDAIWGIAVAALSAVIAFLYKLLVRSQAREDKAVADSQRMTEMLLDVLGSQGDRAGPDRPRRRAAPKG